MRNTPKISTFIYRLWISIYGVEETIMLMLMGQVKRMLCLMYGNCPSHRLDNMKEKALKRKVCTSRSWSDGNVIRIANIDLVLDLYKKRNLQGVPKKIAARNFEGCVWKPGFGPKWPGLT